MAYKNIYEEEYNLCGSVFKLNCQKKVIKGCGWGIYFWFFYYSGGKKLIKNVFVIK